MSRAQGKHTQRKVTIEPDTPEGRQIGMSDRTVAAPSPIPGGETHIVNYETVRQRVPVPDSPPEYGNMNAHGVPPGKSTFHDRAELERGPNDHKPVKPAPVAKPVEKPAPIPVYVVTQGGGSRMLRTATARQVTLQASTGEAVRLCGVNNRRSHLLLLNESQSSDARIGQTIGDVETGGGGALLPWPGNSYLKLDTQDEMWAISADAGTPTISVIEEFDTPAGG